MVRTATETREVILRAATAEFAASGLAGARVDRIAAAAGVNKERIYAYFGSKDALFDACLAAAIGVLLDSVPFTPTDLPGYAERYFDFATDHPELVRLALWFGLERPGGLAGFEATVASIEDKIELLTEEQVAGRLDATVPPVRLLELIQGIVHAAIWAHTPIDVAARAEQRVAVRAAVERLTA